EQDGLHYYVMQFIPGLGLDQVLNEVRRQRGEAALAAADSDASLHVVRRDGLAADVAQSLLSGQLPPGALDQAPVGAPAADGPNPAAASERPAPSPSDVTGDYVPGAAPRSVPAGGMPAAGRLSDTYSVSDSSAAVRGRGRRHTYWHSIAHIGVQAAGALAYAH